MNTTKALVMTVTMAGALGLAFAQAPKGETVVDSVQVTATVVKIDHKTREVTLKQSNGEELSFVAGEQVRNLAQVQVGDVVKTTYTEALAWEVKKGGGEPTAQLDVVGGRAEAGKQPAGAVAQQLTVTVSITAIDPTVPSVTVKGPKGNSRTFKVRYPERLKGVSVGDTVEITYTEALAITVEKAPKP